MSVHKLIPTRIQRRGVYAQFGGDFNDFTLHWGGIATFRAEGGHTLHKSVFTQDQDLLQLFEQSEAKAALEFQNGAFLLHSGCVCVNGKAVIFVGNAGTGKSTTTAAFVQAGYAPLADDITVIKFIDNKPYVIPDGPRVKIWDTTVKGLNVDNQYLTPCIEGHNKFYYEFSGGYPTEPVPLAAIYILHRSNRYPKILPIALPHISFELIKHFPLPHFLLKDEVLKRHFEQALLIGTHAKVLKYKRPKGFDNLRAFVENFNQENL